MEYTSFSSTYETFTNVDKMLGHKTEFHKHQNNAKYII